MEAEIFECQVCGLHYLDEPTAKKCQAWCNEHQSCNMDIAKLSVEAQGNKP